MLMEVSRTKVADLMQRYCAGNYNRFARELGVNPSHLHRFINTGVGGGKKILVSIMKFCKDHGVDFEEIIDL